MSNRGIRFERECLRLLEGEGWVVSPRRHQDGGGDLHASRRDEFDSGAPEVILVECKTTAGGPYERFGPAERAKFRATAYRAGGNAWLFWRPPRGELNRIHEWEWPE